VERIVSDTTKKRPTHARDPAISHAVRIRRSNSRSSSHSRVSCPESLSTRTFFKEGKAIADSVGRRDDPTIRFSRIQHRECDADRSQKLSRTSLVSEFIHLENFIGICQQLSEISHWQSQIEKIHGGTSHERDHSVSLKVNVRKIVSKN